MAIRRSGCIRSGAAVAEPADRRVSGRVQRISAGQPVAGGCGRCAADGREVTRIVSRALGLPNFDQATRMLDLQLDKSIDGNTFVEFETTVKGSRDRAGRSDHDHVSEGRAGAAAVPSGEAGAGAELSDGAGDGAVARRRWYTTGGAGTRAGGGRAGRSWACRGRWWEACSIRTGSISSGSRRRRLKGRRGVHGAVERGVRCRRRAGGTGVAIPLVSLESDDERRRAGRWRAGRRCTTR